MAEKFLKKIITQNKDDLRIISALCSEAKIKQSDIKFLKENKIFLLSLQRQNKEISNSIEKINSILKFEFIEKSMSKNIDQKNKENILELLAIETYKKENCPRCVSKNGRTVFFKILNPKETVGGRNQDAACSTPHPVQ